MERSVHTGGDRKGGRLMLKPWKTSGGSVIRQVLSSRTNIFLLSSGHADILVDTGQALQGRALIEHLEYLGVEHINYVLQTHTHFDHCGNTAKIAAKFGARVFAHEADAAFLREGRAVIPQGTMPVTRGLVRVFGSWIGPAFNFRPCPCDVYGDNAPDFKALGLNIRIMPTPGHTAGSVSVIVDEELALVGDSLFGIFKNSAMPPFADDPAELVRSWDKLLSTGCSTFLPGHGRAISKDLLRRCLETKR
jgi:glyoxylase-like metal-dependent hydrolase (beta-lactamase superfamily II)